MLEPDKVKPGMIAIDYHGYHYEAIMCVPVYDYELVMKYDDSGLFDKNGEFIEE